jgi:predicted dehydrogenase
MKPLNLVVIGSGMYVCGAGTDGYGTIMPAICQWRKKAPLGEVYIAGATRKNILSASKKIRELEKMMGVKVSPRYFPEAKDDPEAYRKAICQLAKPACAIIAVPDNLHRKIAGDVIGKGLHTLVVKPLAPTTKEVKELIGIQRKSGVWCAVEFHKRLDYANIKLKDAISNGRIGDPLYFLVEYSQRKSVPSQRFKKWVKSTNVFQYLGVHYVDIISFATRAQPLRAMAIGRKGWLLSKGIDIHDSIEAVIEWLPPSGKKFTSHILTNWVDPESTSAMSDQRIKVIGTAGRFESDQKDRGIIIVTDKDGVETPNPYFCSAYGPHGGVDYRGYGIDSVCQFVEDAIGVEEKVLKISDLEKIRPSFRQAIVPALVLEAVMKSLKNDGRWINIEEDEI